MNGTSLFGHRRDALDAAEQHEAGEEREDDPGHPERDAEAGLDHGGDGV